MTLPFFVMLPLKVNLSGSGPGHRRDELDLFGPMRKRTLLTGVINSGTQPSDGSRQLPTPSHQAPI
jgi:hypothetical protein